MKFYTDRHQNVKGDYKWRMVSDNDVWEITLYRMMYGVRVRYGRVGGMWCITDYCAGADENWQMMLMSAVRMIAETLPEDCKDSEMQALFPPQNQKPIWNDPVLWNDLRDRAAKVKPNAQVEQSA